MADELAQTLQQILGTDNEVRKVAEKRYSDARAQNPGPTVAALFQVLSEPQRPDGVREQAAVLLRQCMGKLREEGSTWSKLGEQAHGECKAKLLQLMEGEVVPKVRRLVAAVVQGLGNQLIDIEQNARPTNIDIWPEMMPTLMRIIMDGSKDAGLRADALWTVKEMLTCMWQVMVANGQQTLMVLKTCLGDVAVGVRCSAAGLFCEMIDNLDAKAERDAFTPLIQDFCLALEAVASSGSQEQINSVLQAMEGTNNSVDFFKDRLVSDLMPRLSTIATSHAQADTRRLALEVLISFAESRPKTIAKVQGYVELILDICVRFLMELDDDLDNWGDQDDAEAEDEEQYTAGKEVVDRLCRCMNKAEQFPKVLETLKPVLANFLQSQDWKQAVAGITIISQIAEYVDEEVMVVQMVNGVQAFLKAAHPRIRHAAWMALAQLSEDHDEYVTSETVAPQLLPLFLAGLDDPHSRVVTRCMEAFQLYGQEVEREILEPFVQPMMEKLGVKLQSGKTAVQQQTITYIAVLAGQVEDSFAVYYAPLMPVLKQIIQAVLQKPEERTLLGKAFECVSLLAKAIGTAGFRADAEIIMQAMVQAVQTPNQASNDPVKEYMMQASSRICWTMKADFLPFVPHILPGILEKFQLAPKELNDQTRKNLDGGEGDELNMTLIQGTDGEVKVLVMSTSEMEDLQNAIECVHTFVEELGKLYVPFVAQTAQALLPVFDFSMAEHIRDLAFETWGELCKVAREGGQPDVLSQLVQEFLKRVVPKLEEATGNGIDLEALKTQADGISACLKAAGPGILTAQQLQHIGELCLNAMDVSTKREEVEAQKKKDDDEGADDDDDETDEAAFQIACCEVIGALMRHHQDIFVATFLPRCMPIVQQLVQPSMPESKRKIAIFFACDMLQHLETRITAQWPQFLPQVIADIVNPSTDIRQPACYAVALAAKNPAFAQFAMETSQTLMKVVTDARARAKKKSERPAQAVADNALSAIAEILLHHQPTVAAIEAQLWSVWLQALPCQEDEEEGKKNHGVLLKMVQAEKREIVGEGGANLPQAFSVLIDVYKSDMAEEETSKGIGQLVVKVGESALEQLAQQLKEKQKKKLLRIHREAQQAS